MDMSHAKLATGTPTRVHVRESLQGSAVVLPLRASAVLALAVGAERAVGAFNAVGFAHVKAEEVGALGLLRLLLATTTKEFGNFS